MENKNLKRTIYIDNNVEKSIEEAVNLVVNYRAAVCNWNIKDKMQKNTIKLKRELKIDDLVRVKIKILNSSDKCDENLRLYIYVTNQCHLSELNTKGVSHALQASLGNESARSNWVSADSGFSAKVFLDDVGKLTNLVEDIVLDMQMFYYYGYNIEYSDYKQRREFSKKKVDFLSKCNLQSYLGKIVDPEYISFASFCRDEDDMEINITKYCKIWKEFYEKTGEGKDEDFENNVNDLFKKHPKYGQLSLKKIEKILQNLPRGEYILVRTEKQPQKSKNYNVIKTYFGMKTWKTGKIKIVEAKYRFTFQKMFPYVSVYEFKWKGM